MIGKANDLQMSPSLQGREQVNAWLNVQMPTTEVANIIAVTTEEIDYFYIIYKIGKDPCCGDPFCIGDCKVGESA